MKDAMTPCEHATLLGDVVYKDVVVIGNGPSGIVTSYILAGNVPRLKELPSNVPIDDMLKARLSNLKPGSSLYEADLMQLAQGLEGRSQNPVPLLMDNLLRPGADAGNQVDPLVTWQFNKDKQIDHIVLGRGLPGGSWQTFPSAVQTLSPAGWLTLPPKIRPGESTKRQSAKKVAKYCESYVAENKLERYFRDVEVTSVCLRQPDGPPCGGSCPRNARYCVTGYASGLKPVYTTRCQYICNRVVLACGANDIPNKLNVPQLDKLAVHSLAEVSQQIDTLKERDAKRRPTVLVVGSGMSAADAVQMALRANCRVAHVHRSPAEALVNLSPATYPEYAEICAMMRNGPSSGNDTYTSYPDTAIIDACAPNSQYLANDHQASKAIIVKKVKLRNKQNEITELTVNIIAVLIGSRPNLSFLQLNYGLNCTPDLELCKKCNEIENGKNKMQKIKSPWQSLKDLLVGISCKRMLISEINGNDLPNYYQKYDGLVPLEIQAKKEKIDTCTCYVYKCPCTADFTTGLGYGRDPKNPVDGRENPLAIDKGSHQLFYAPKGVYALGPLSGDNVIRFIPGGALAIVAHIHKDKKDSALLGQTA